MTRIITAYARRINADRLGIVASLLCAIHCSILPVITSLLPLSGLSIFERPEVEIGFILSSLGIALYSLVPSYLNSHKNITPLLFVLFGFTCIASGHFLFEHAELYTSTLGGLSIAYAHVLNIIILKRKVAEKNF